jgi:hypothetical protein
MSGNAARPIRRSHALPMQDSGEERLGRVDALRPEWVCTISAEMTVRTGAKRTRTSVVASAGVYALTAAASVDE